MIDKELKRYAKQLERKMSQRKWKKFLRAYYARLECADEKEKEILGEFFKQTVLKVTKKEPCSLPPKIVAYAKLCQ